MTEYQQPINPMRVYMDAGNRIICCYVFAVVINNHDSVEFLTIDGNWVQRAIVRYSEMLVNGQWESISSVLNESPRV